MDEYHFAGLVGLAYFTWLAYRAYRTGKTLETTMYGAVVCVGSSGLLLYGGI